jgi:hypothetical protein
VLLLVSSLTVGDIFKLLVEAIQWEVSFEMLVKLYHVEFHVEYNRINQAILIISLIPKPINLLIRVFYFHFSKEIDCDILQLTPVTF